MARTSRTLSRILSGSADRSIRFEDLCNLLLGIGFHERIRGDHFIYSYDGISAIINLQPRDGGMAKAYQVQQVRAIIVKHKLAGASGQ